MQCQLLAELVSGHLRIHEEVRLKTNYGVVIEGSGGGARRLASKLERLPDDARGYPATYQLSIVVRQGPAELDLPVWRDDANALVLVSAIGTDADVLDRFSLQHIEAQNSPEEKTADSNGLALDAKLHSAEVPERGRPKPITAIAPPMMRGIQSLRSAKSISS